MLRRCAILLAAGAAFLSAADQVTWTGWFSDAQCAAARAKVGLFTATNRDCALKCMRQGAAAVFIAENAKAVLKVKGYDGLKSDLGYRVEVQGTVEDDVLHVNAVKHLEYQGPSCARPKSK